MEAAGLLNTEHLELVEGELINRLGKRRPHSECARILDLWLVQVFGVRYVNFASPVNVAPGDNPTSQPVPDLIVLSRSYTGFQTTIPCPTDLSLVVEIADTTLEFNLGSKAAIYARAGVVDYWVLDVQGRRMIVHRDPRNGRYQSVVAYNENESVAPLAAPESAFPIRQAVPE